VTSVLTAVTHRHEAEFVRVLEEARDVVLVRRCADLAELLSAGAAGVARVAVVSPDLRGLDRDALRHLAGHGVRVAGLVPGGEEDGERRLRQLGVATVLRPDDDADTVAVALTGLAGSTTSGSQATAGSGATTDAAAWHGIRTADPLDPDPSEGATDAGAPVRTPLTVVWGPTGAPGRTTVAVTLAATMAGAGVRTLLVDLDTWGASVAQVLGLVDEAPGTVAAARASEQGTLDVPRLARLAPEVLPGLRVLTGLPSPDRWPELRAAAVEDVLRLARGVVDHVVVDVGFSLEDDEELSYDTAAPRRNAATLAALEAADQLVAVGAADPVGLQRLVRGVQDLGVVASPTPLVVVNKVRAGVAGHRPERAIAEVLGRFAGLEQVRFLPWEPEACDAALLAGKALPEVAPRGPLASAVGELAAQLEPRVAPAGRPAGRRRAHSSHRLGRRGATARADGRGRPHAV
jgi:MinD-like ATPase involved in chromosome partitioning or flagellar assembly